MLYVQPISMHVLLDILVFLSDKMMKDTRGTAESAHCKRAVAEMKGAEKAFWSVVLPSEISLTPGSAVGFTCSLWFPGYFTDVIPRVFHWCNSQGIAPLSEMRQRQSSSPSHGASARSLLPQPSPPAGMAREGWENSTACFRNPPVPSAGGEQ